MQRMNVTYIGGPCKILDFVVKHTAMFLVNGQDRNKLQWSNKTKTVDLQIELH